MSLTEKHHIQTFTCLTNFVSDGVKIILSEYVEPGFSSYGNMKNLPSALTFS